MNAPPPPLPRRLLGRSGVEVSALGFGVSGPMGTPLMSDGEVAALVREALDLGMSLFDTAPFYGEAERRLGAALRGVPRERYQLVSKAGTRRGLTSSRKDFSEAALRRDLETSLRALGVNRLEAFLLHGPTFAEAAGAELTLSRMQAEGLIQAAGVCTRGEISKRFLELDFLKIMQAPVDQATLLQERLTARGWGFIGIEAMRAAASDLRAPASGADIWYVARGLRRPNTPKGDPPTALAAAMRTPVDCVVVTTTRRAHLRENADIATRGLA